MKTESVHLYLVSPGKHPWVNRFSEFSRGRFSMTHCTPSEFQQMHSRKKATRSAVVYYCPETSANDGEWFSHLQRCIESTHQPCIVVMPEPSAPVKANLLAAGAAGVYETDSSVPMIVSDVVSLCNVEPIVNTIKMELVAPFVSATTLTFTEVCNLHVHVKKIERLQVFSITSDFSVWMNLNAAVPGILVMSFPHATAHAVASAMLLPMGVEANNDLVKGCLAEIVNIITGQAKGTMAETGNRYTMSVPTVLSGDGHEINYKSGLPGLLASFSCECGEFFLYLCMSHRKLIEGSKR